MSRGRVLIVSYYFPPAGGSGVHRVLKLCKYLPEFGWDVEVLAPDDPARDYPKIDDAVRGMAFIEAVVKSSKRNAAWTKLDV